MSETVEAIQADLETYGLILWPGSPENPPRRISVEDVFKEQPRKFDKPNVSALVFKYKYDARIQYWELIE